MTTEQEKPNREERLKKLISQKDFERYPITSFIEQGISFKNEKVDYTLFEDFIQYFVEQALAEQREGIVKELEDTKNYWISEKLRSNADEEEIIVARSKSETLSYIIASITKETL